MPYKFELNKSFWSLNFVEPYWKLFDQFKTDVLGLPSYSNYLAAQKNYNQAVQNYKVNHSPFKYGFIIFCLFFSWLGFIVLWFKNYAYYKKLKENKFALLKQIDEAKEKRLIASETYANEIDITNFIKDVYELLKFQEVGPINQYLYHNIMENNGLDLKCNNTINPYQSSWGIWDKNKIVFNMNMQETITTMRTYTGSTLASSKYGNENSISTLTATYSHPFSDVIVYHNRYFAYMHACERLNFKFNKGNLKSLISKKQKLENDEFNRVFKFDYDDEIQYRMIFTPHKQEIMINEYQLNNKLFPEDELNKSGPYLYTNYSTPTSLDTLTAEADELLDKFKTDVNFGIQKYLNELGNVVYYGLQDLFRALKHLFTTPIIYSENHKTMINNALNDHNYEFYLPHYVLNKVIKEEIIHYDSPCFNEIKSNIAIKLNKEEMLYCCIMDGLSYKHEPRVINLPPDDSVSIGGIGRDLIEVHYIETVPYRDQIMFYYAPIVSSQTRSTTLAMEEVLNKLTSAKQNKLEEIISEASSKDIIFYLKENFIAAKVSNNRNYDQDEIKTYFQDIIKILKRK